MLTRTTDYSVRLKFGDVEVTVDPYNMKEFTITQDINNFLPSFRIKTVDRQGLLTHIVPFDRRVSKIFIQFSGFEDIQKAENHNYLNFIVHRKFPNSDGLFHIEGLLDVDGLFYPNRTIGREGAVSSIVEDISENELRVVQTDISPSLTKIVTMVQGDSSNADFLKWLKDWSSGTNNEGCYFCFIRVRRGVRELVFRSLHDFVRLEPVNNFAFFREKVEDYYPILDYQMVDTFTSHRMMGYKTQTYSYFDYYLGEYVSSSLDTEDYFSLAEKFLIDSNRPDEDVNEISNLGRNKEDDRTYLGRVKGLYYKALTSLSKMWITTRGMQNICPGDIVLLAFPGPSIDGKILDYQYSGFWLVERIIHSFGTSYISKILLTRNGVDSTIESTLLPANKKKTRSRESGQRRTFSTPTVRKEITGTRRDGETITIS